MATPSANCKALIFDLMGTCCDWHTTILKTLTALPVAEEHTLPRDQLSSLALSWRSGFFAEIHARFEQGLPQEDIDTTHRRVLDSLLLARGINWNDEVRSNLVQAWHHQVSWPDAVPALQRLRERFFVVVLANGTTRLQLDIARSTGLPFHMLFSSQLLGLTKPDPRIYRKAAELMGLGMEECVMVAAHAYDLRAAKEVGMKTVYIRRMTEDVGEDFSAIERDVDLFLDGRGGSMTCGLGALAASVLD